MQCTDIILTLGTLSLSRIHPTTHTHNTHKYFVGLVLTFALVKLLFSKYSDLAKMTRDTYGAKFVPKLNRQIQHFVNKRNLLCKRN